jgi:hypothetical protein
MATRRLCLHENSTLALYLLCILETDLFEIWNVVCCREYQGFNQVSKTEKTGKIWSGKRQGPLFLSHSQEKVCISVVMCHHFRSKL